MVATWDLQGVSEDVKVTALYAHFEDKFSPKRFSLYLSLLKMMNRLCTSCTVSSFFGSLSNTMLSGIHV